MYLNRKSHLVFSDWGIDTQPQRLETTLKYSVKNDLILDMGAGRGAYTDILSRFGLNPVGFDINMYADWAKLKNRNYLVGSGKRLPFRNKAFDVTIAFEVLEHIPDPAQALNEISRCTKNKLIFSVPNCDIDNNLRRHDLAMAHWTDPTHCNFFTKESLQTFLLTNGFTPVEMIDCYRISPNDYYWDSIKLPRLITQIPKFIMKTLKLSEVYWSSILVVAEVP